MACDDDDGDNGDFMKAAWHSSEVVDNGSAEDGGREWS